MDGQKRPDIMRRAASLIGRNGIVSILVLNVCQSGCGFLKRLFPGYLDPFAIDLPDRFAQPVRIGVYVLQAGRLGADISLAQYMIGVTLDRQDIGAVMLDRNPAHRLAQMAGPKMHPNWPAVRRHRHQRPSN